MTLSTDQTLPNRVGAGTAQMGSTAGVDTNDPVRPVWAGENYVYLPGTTGNSITFPRPYATTHYTITYTDDTTDTGTTTADPVVIGGTAHSGSVASVVLRETDGAGAIGETLIVDDGLTGWTVTRSATGLKTAVVTRSVMSLDGIDDFVQLPASDTPTFTATTGKHTVVLVFRAHNNPPGTRILWDARSASGSGPTINLLATGGIRSAVYGGSGNGFKDSPARAADGSLQCVAMVVNDGNVATYAEGALTATEPISGAGVFTMSQPRVGTLAYTVSLGAECEILACLTFKDQALTETQLDAIATKLIAGNYA